KYPQARVYAERKDRFPAKEWHERKTSSKEHAVNNEEQQISPATSDENDVSTENNGTTPELQITLVISDEDDKSADPVVRIVMENDASRGNTITQGIGMQSTGVETNKGKSNSNPFSVFRVKSRNEKKHLSYLVIGSGEKLSVIEGISKEAAGFNEKLLGEKDHNEQHGRVDNCALRAENDKIRCVNIAIREALRNVICPSCGGPPVNEDSYFDEHKLRIENAQLNEELDRVSSIAAKYIGRSISHLPLVQLIHVSSLDLSMASFGGHGMGGGQSSLDLDFDLLPQQQSSQQPLGGLSSINKLMMMDIFGNDAEELLKLLRSIGTFHKHLNFEVPLGGYLCSFEPHK
ncbi:Homeobox-leucine zipper protein HDG11, partial [Linum perenne]